MNTLKEFVAERAFHNAAGDFDDVKCHEGTRTTLLQEMVRWASGQISMNELISWIYGAAGSGKSAIERSLAELCELKTPGISVSCFFFFRSDRSRNHSKAFVATILYQMAVKTPALRKHIASVLENDPLILTKSLETQITSLIAQPLQNLIAEGSFCGRYLFIIDGLDECMDGSCVNLVKAISQLVTSFGTSIPIAVSFASRPERDLKDLFMHSPHFSNRIRRVALDVDYKADDDIRRFLSDKFAEIRRSHYYLPCDWPSEDQMKHLVWKASGQFIYASTVQKFVRDNPEERLNIVLGTSPTKGTTPFAELDALYTEILQSVPTECREEGVRIISCTHVFNNVAAVDASCALTAALASVPLGRLIMHIDNYASLVCRRDPGDKNNKIKLLHTSLGDFLFDPDRSGNLSRIFENEVMQVFRQAIRLMIQNPTPEILLTETFEFFLLFEGCFDYLQNKHLIPYEDLCLLNCEDFFCNTAKICRAGPDQHGYEPRWMVSGVFTDLTEFLRAEPLVEDTFRRLILGIADRVLYIVLKHCDPLLTLSIKLNIWAESQYGKDYQAYTHLYQTTIMGCYDIEEADFWDDSGFGWELPIHGAKGVDAFFQDPARWNICRDFLNPQAWNQFAVRFIMYIIGVLPGHAPNHLHCNAGVCNRQKMATYNVVSLDDSDTGYRFGRSIWPRLSSEHDIYDHEFVIEELMETIHLILKSLPYILDNASKSSKLYNLCKRPNMKRFPWVLVPKSVLNVGIEAMAKYRRQFRTFPPPKIVLRTTSDRVYSPAFEALVGGERGTKRKRGKHSDL